MGLIYLQSMSYPPRHQNTHTIIVKKTEKALQIRKLLHNLAARLMSNQAGNRQFLSRLESSVPCEKEHLETLNTIDQRPESVAPFEKPGR